MSDKLREALEAVLSAGRGPSGRIILERYQEDKLREALAADDAARGAMREAYDKWYAASTFETMGHEWTWAGWQAGAAWQASRAAAPIPVPNSRQLSEVIAEYEAMPERAVALADARASLKAAAPQSVKPVAYWPEFPPFPTWISANDLHSLQEWAQTVRRDAFAAGMQRAAQQSVEPDGTLHADGYFTWTAGRRPAYMLDRGLPCKFYLAPPSAPTDAAWRAENERLRVALRFYARGEHYNLDESEEFDTVSGAPENWLCSGLEDSATMIETGRVALSALQGVELSWLDGDEDCTPQPVEGEKALRAHLSTCPQHAEEWIACSEKLPNPDSGEVLVWLWESKLYAIDEWHTYREDPTGMGGPTLDMGLMWRNFDFDEVSHWRPLPAPPTKTKERP